MKQLGQGLAQYLYETGDSGYQELEALQSVIREAVRGKRHIPDRLKVPTYRYFESLVYGSPEYRSLVTEERVRLASLFAGLFKSNTLGDPEALPCDLLQLSVAVRGATEIVACLPVSVFNTPQGKRMIMEFFSELGVGRQEAVEPTCKLFLAFGTARNAQRWWICLRDLLTEKTGISDEDVEQRLTVMHERGVLRSVVIDEYIAFAKLIIVNPHEDRPSHFLIFEDAYRPDQGIRCGGYPECTKWLECVHVPFKTNTGPNEFGPLQTYQINFSPALAGSA